MIAPGLEKRPGRSSSALPYFPRTVGPILPLAWFLSTGLILELCSRGKSFVSPGFKVEAVSGNRSFGVQFGWGDRGLETYFQEHASVAN